MTTVSKSNGLIYSNRLLIEPETIIVYWSTHLAIEFMGPERINELHPSAAIDFRFMDLTSPT